MIKKIYLALALVGIAAAQQANYPTIYSPEAGGPVPNPAYHSQAAAPVISGYALPAPTPMQSSYFAGPTKPINRYMIDLTIGYGFKGVPNSKYATDVTTCELETAYNLTYHQSLTLSFGITSGGKTNNYWVRDERPHHHDLTPFTDSFDRYSLSIMGGYRFTQPLLGGVSLVLGAKCGLDVQTIEIDYGYGWSGYPYNCEKGNRDTKAGMAYAGYASLLFHVSQNSALLLGYQFRGSTCKPSPDSEYSESGRIHSRTMRWHEVRIGLSCRF